MDIAPFVILFFFIAITIAVFASMRVARKSAAPFFPTPKKAIKKTLAAAKLKDGEIFYDLGAGTGQVLRIAEKEFGARATGFEISILFYVIAKINLFLRGSHAKVHFKNFFSADLKNADVIFCFLSHKGMKKLERKIINGSLRPGTRIISYAFPLPGLQAKEILDIHGQWKMFIYVL